MIRKRKKKKKLELRSKQRRQMGLIFGGAVLAAVVAAILPSQCNAPLPPEDQLRDQLEELAKDAESRGSGR